MRQENCSPRAQALGLGFGGWDEYLVHAANQLGLNRTLPLHNALIAAHGLRRGSSRPYSMWQFSSIAAVIWKALRAAETTRDARTTMILAFAILWPAAHSFADNTQIFGTMHTVMLFAAVLAYLENRRSGQPTDSVRTAHAGVEQKWSTHARWGR